MRLSEKAASFFARYSPVLFLEITNIEHPIMNLQFEKN